MKAMRTRIQEVGKVRHMDKVTTARICKYKPCSTVFFPSRHWMRYCSPGCHDKYWKELREEASRLSQGQPEEIVQALRKARGEI